jgi:hypothetical protein
MGGLCGSAVEYKVVDYSTSGQASPPPPPPPALLEAFLLVNLTRTDGKIYISVSQGS